MSKLLTALSASTALIALSSFAANAADLPPRVYKAPVAVAAPYNWTGFYVGAHFGGAWGNKSWQETNLSGLETGCYTPGFYSVEAEGVAFSGFNSPCFGAGAAEASGHTVTGPLGGLQAGYNAQFGNFVIGIEGQFSWSSLKGSHSDSKSASQWFEEQGCFNFGEFCYSETGLVNINNTDRFSTKVKNISTIAARLGFVGGAEGKTMFFVKGGVAYARDSYSLQRTGTISEFLAGSEDCEGGSCTYARTFAAGVSQQLSGDSSRWGSMVGIGLEFALAGNWTAKVEYDYLHFGTKQVSLTGTECVTEGGERGPFTLCNPITRTFNVGQSINLVKFGLNYRFGDWGKGKAPAPLVTKY
jgi:outer membrane immunogenic protein